MLDPPGIQVSAGHPGCAQRGFRLSLAGLAFPASPPTAHMPHNSVVEVPVVLDRSLFSGEGPIEIKLKLYIK